MELKDVAFEGGRWAEPDQWGELDIYRPSPRLHEAVALGRDLLAAPHLSVRRDVFMLECRDAATRLMGVAADQEDEDPAGFIASFLAMLVLEVARK